MKRVKLRYLSKSRLGLLGRDLNGVQSRGKRINSGYLVCYKRAFLGGLAQEFNSCVDAIITKSLLLNWTSDFYTAFDRIEPESDLYIFLMVYSIFDCQKE